MKEVTICFNFKSQDLIIHIINNQCLHEPYLNNLKVKADWRGVADGYLQATSFSSFPNININAFQSRLTPSGSPLIDTDAIQPQLVFNINVPLLVVFLLHYHSVEFKLTNEAL